MQASGSLFRWMFGWTVVVTTTLLFCCWTATATGATTTTTTTTTRHVHAFVPTSSPCCLLLLVQKQQKQQPQQQRIISSSYASRTSISQNKAPMRLALSSSRHSTATITTNNNIYNTSHWICTTLGFVILVGYHGWLYRKEQQQQQQQQGDDYHPTTWRSHQAKTRQEWSQFVRHTEGWLYAIQTLRNAITANTFLSTTVLSLLTVITGRLWEEILKSTARTDKKRYYLLIVQFAMIASTMLTSAYQFLQAARLMTHAGFMFPTSLKYNHNKHDNNNNNNNNNNNDNDNSNENSRRLLYPVDRIMRKSENSQWFGLRWLYLSITIISWMVGGPYVFLMAAIVSAFFFHAIDQAPEE